jgi:hypothetical protein
MLLYTRASSPQKRQKERTVWTRRSRLLTPAGSSVPTSRPSNHRMACVSGPVAWQPCIKVVASLGCCISACSTAWPTTDYTGQACSALFRCLILTMCRALPWCSPACAAHWPAAAVGDSHPGRRADSERPAFPQAAWSSGMISIPRTRIMGEGLSEIFCEMLTARRSSDSPGVPRASGGAPERQCAASAPLPRVSRVNVAFWTGRPKRAGNYGKGIDLS